MAEEYSLHHTPASRVHIPTLEEQSTAEVPMAQAAEPYEPMERPMDVTEAGRCDFGHDNDNIISTHGYMCKQGQRIIKGPIHKSWKRRYFGAYYYNPYPETLFTLKICSA